jgi:hypothetical protein
MSFVKDLNYGNKAEELFCEYLDTLPETYSVFQMEGNFPHFDIVQICKSGEIKTYEIKSDRKWMDTGNIVIEVGTKTNNSGVLGSKANHLVYLLEGDSFYITTIKELRDFYLSDNKCREVMGGDRYSQTLLVVPVHKMLNFFKKITDFSIDKD